MFEVSEQLRAHGHEQLFFAMEHAKNRPCAQSQYFVSTIEYRNSSLAYKMKTALPTVGKTVYSYASRRKLAALLDAEKPDIAHIHLITNQISPSILHALRDANIPTVQTVHEYNLVCPIGLRYIARKGELCDRCLGGNYLHSVVHRCTHDAILPSALAAGAKFFHHATRIYERNIDVFIAPSQFMADTLVNAKVPPEKVHVLLHELDLEQYRPQFEAGDTLVYFGRLSPEKGIRTLLESMEQLPDIPLVIVGDGPQRVELEGIAGERNLKNVRFEGYLSGEALHDVIRKAFAVVVPSECYDNSPMAVYEAQALGKPVIASRIGGIPELVQNGETGYLFDAGDIVGLAEKIRTAAANPANCTALGEAARRRVETLCHAHYDQLLSLYALARSRH